MLEAPEAIGGLPWGGGPLIGEGLRYVVSEWEGKTPVSPVRKLPDLEVPERLRSPSALSSWPLPPSSLLLLCVSLSCAVLDIRTGEARWEKQGSHNVWSEIVMLDFAKEFATSA